MRRIFFAERQIDRVPGIGRHIATREVREGTVIGTGIMGSGIAMHFAHAGIPVALFDLRREQRDRTMATMERNHASAAAGAASFPPASRAALESPSVERYGRRGPTRWKSNPGHQK